MPLSVGMRGGGSSGAIASFDIEPRTPDHEFADLMEFAALANGQR